MYVPPAFDESRRDVLYGLIQTYPFGVLVSHDPGMDGAPVASHLPFLLDPGLGPDGTLLTHLAKPNGQWKALARCAEAGREVLAIFQGPHAYVSPGWYAPEVRSRSVPTWNYAVVHAYGRPRLIGDDAGVLDLLRRTVRQFEGGSEGDADGRSAWRIDELAEDFLTAMTKGVVGVEVEITRLQGKFKLNQNRSAEDRARVAAELSHSPDATARDVAALMSPADTKPGPSESDGE